MKFTLIVATAAIGLFAGSAFAGEGAGDPFPFRAAGVTTVTTGRAALPGGLDDPYPFRANSSPSISAQMLPTNGSEGGLETLNSLPKGAEIGTVAYAHQQSVRNYFQAQAAAHAATARVIQHPRIPAPTNG